MLNVVRVAALAALLVLPFTVRAEQAAPPADQAAMPCPHAGKDGCCGGACAEMQAKAAAGTSGKAAQGEEGSCPCQRAAKAAAEEAAKQKSAQP
ncbi:MAG TPA: hypothetical protein VL049_09955 [Candidatus Dormibacteraeota bacterium]|nr:hypothetical protein [Candidatus Dormibacteraeota bacterium]